MNRIIQVTDSSRVYHKLLNEYSTHLLTVKLDGVYEGYRVECYKFESTKGMTWYEASSAGVDFSTPNTYKTKEEMMSFYQEWVDELNS